MERNKIFKYAEDICLSGKDSLEMAVTAFEQGVPISRFDGLDEQEKEELSKILKSVIKEYRNTA